MPGYPAVGDRCPGFMYEPGVDEDEAVGAPDEDDAG